MYRKVDNEYAEKLNNFIEAEEPFSTEHLQKAVEFLKYMHRTVLDLYVYEGKSPTVISAILDSNVIRIQEIIRYNKRIVYNHAARIARIARGDKKDTRVAKTETHTRKKSVPGTVYYYGNTQYISSLLKKHGMPESDIEQLNFETVDSGMRSKDIIEDYLDKNGLLYVTPFSAISNALKPGNSSLISMDVHIEELLFEPLGCSYGLLTHFRYGCENIPATIWLPVIRYRFSFRENIIRNNLYLEYFSIKNLSLFGILKVDKDHKTIDIIPLIVTNI